MPTDVIICVSTLTCRGMNFSEGDWEPFIMSGIIFSPESELEKIRDK
jgi:hypothetical protein